MESAEHNAIVAHRAGTACVIAGPGCGKTGACADRTAALYRVVSRPDRVLCVTFSVEAAGEMRRRISRKTGYSEKTLAACVSTFHSIAFRILREEGLVSGRDTVITRSEQDRILREFVPRAEIAGHRAHIAAMRRALVRPNRDDDDNVYGAYDARLRENRKTDFDSMVYFAVMHLRENPAAREKWQARFAFVIVDEAHDMSFDQMELAKLLAAPENNLMIVYDRSQSIFFFRGADPAILENIDNPKIFYLSENHRSGREIIEAFLPFAEQDAASLELAQRTRAVSDVPARVAISAFADSDQEAHAVVAEICAGALLPRDCAILTRTRAELVPYCEALRLAGTGYNWRGVSFWEERDIKRALDYCEYCADPKRGFPSKIPAFLRRSLARLADVAPYARPVDLLRAMRGEMGIGISFDDDRADDYAQENFDALIRLADPFKFLADFIGHCRLARQEAKMKQGVTLSTIHAAKGLEWRNVFLIGLSRNRMPHPRSESPDEERRLVYVALSRAREYLWVSYAGEPSVFVEMLETRKKVAA